MTTPNIEELRKLAEECLDRDPLEEGDVSFPGFSTSWCALQREFIMAANPSTVIALLDQLQSQAERIAELERESETHSKAYGLAIVERDNLRHELKTAQEGWRCECSTDDACRFARERDALRAQLAAIAATEPVAWFAFADSNGPVPLELFGWDEKACKHAVLTYARAGNWKGTVEGYLLQQGWTLKPLFTRPMPAQDVTELVFVADMLPQRFEHSTCYGGHWTSDWVVAFDANGGATVTRLVISNSTKKLMDADKNYRPLWLAQGNPVVAWMYKTSVKEALSKYKGAK